MNFVIPRAGEVVRCGTIQKLSGVPADTAFGTVVLERLIDVLMLGLMLLVLLIVELNHLSSFFLSFLGDKMTGFQNLLWIGLVFLLVFVVFVITLVLSWKKLKKSPLFEKINKILLNVLEGILSIQKLENRFAFVFHTLLIWFLYYLMAYVLFFCFKKTENLDMWFGFIILVMGAIGMATPVQGGFGAYHILVGNVFALRGLSVNDGIILATFMHTVQTLIVLSVGGLSFLIVIYLANKSSKVGKL
jgi:MFS family permease